MQVTATEFKLNMGKYLSMASRHDIFITKNGQRIARLTNPSPDRVAMLDSLVGIAQGTDISLDDIKKERLENT
ncbi:MAG: type II toxin-antitoxin system prevent-host-death family antitoxin [Clostridia bacterium]|nr:type II toxin-antitoxin system prevent-host-death family antitoxin [Clostridia bacterium]